MKRNTVGAVLRSVVLSVRHTCERTTKVRHGAGRAVRAHATACGLLDTSPHGHGVPGTAHRLDHVGLVATWVEKLRIGRVGGPGRPIVQACTGRGAKLIRWDGI